MYLHDLNLRKTNILRSFYVHGLDYLELGLPEMFDNFIVSNDATFPQNKLMIKYLKYTLL